MKRKKANFILISFSSATNRNVPSVSITKTLDHDSNPVSEIIIYIVQINTSILYPIRNQDLSFLSTVLCVSYSFHR